jgi:hypothetical protein
MHMGTPPRASWWRWHGRGGLSWTGASRRTRRRRGFRCGGSTLIRLADGRQLQLHELRVAPRRADASLINGSFWIDAENHAVVRAYFSLTGELRDEGSLLSVLAAPGPAGLIDYVSIDYGLSDMDWWLPRTVAARGVMQFGARLRLRTARGLDPAAPRWAAELDLHGETGDFSFARPALQVYSTLPLPLRLSLSSELAGGTGVGDLPQQRLWQIGGVLRAYDPAATRPRRRTQPRLLDLAGGTAVVARRVAARLPRFGALRGLDIRPAMSGRQATVCANVA